MKRVYNFSFFIFVALLFASIVFPPSVLAAPTRDVGIWYSALYSAEKNYIWGYGMGVGNTNRMVSDVNGDHKDDIAIFYNSTGTWHVLLSNSNGFDQSINWAQGHGSGSTDQFLADVDGDGCADAVAYWQSKGAWLVWYSNCLNSFKPDNTERVTGRAFPSDPLAGGHGVGSVKRLMARVDNNNSYDAVIVTPSGDWWVAFGAQGNQAGKTVSDPGYWKKSFGPGAYKYLLADVTGDNLADPVVILNHSGGTGGDWYVSVNSGTYGRAETGYAKWIDGHGVNSTNQMLAQIDGVGGLDAVVMTQRVGNETQADVYGQWYVAYSRYTPGCGTGVCFDASSAGIQWLQSHGYSAKLQNYGYGASDWQGFGDFDNDGKGDPVVFHNNSGEWRVLPSKFVPTQSTNRDPDQMNYWQSNIIRYQPIVGGVPRQYDSFETVVVDEHLNQIGAAGINFLILDLTNGQMGWVYDRSKVVCNQLKTYNQTHAPMKVSFSLGGFQKEADSSVGEAVEVELNAVINYFVNDANHTCQDLLYNDPATNKPLLTLYFRDQVQRDAWLTYKNSHPGSVTYQYSIKYTYGATPYQSGDVSYKCSTKNSQEACDINKPRSSPGSTEYGNFTGWGMPYGTLLNETNNTTAVVMPGWNTNKPGAQKFISRTQRASLPSGASLSDGFYTVWGWNLINSKIPANKPTMVIINSFNEYAEETAVAPTETNQATLPLIGKSAGEKWPSTNFYWNSTIQAIQNYRSN